MKGFLNVKKYREIIIRNVRIGKFSINGEYLIKRNLELSLNLLQGHNTMLEMMKTKSGNIKANMVGYMNRSMTTLLEEV